MSRANPLHVFGVLEHDRRHRRTDHPAGRPLAAAVLGQHLRRLRSVTVNMEFNGALCRGLLAARFDEEPPEDQGAELRRFVGEATRELR
jgi:hypothetical protein